MPDWGSWKLAVISLPGKRHHFHSRTHFPRNRFHPQLEIILRPLNSFLWDPLGQEEEWYILWACHEREWRFMETDSQPCICWRSTLLCLQDKARFNGNGWMFSLMSARPGPKLAWQQICQKCGLCINHQPINSQYFAYQHNTKICDCPANLIPCCSLVAWWKKYRGVLNVKSARSTRQYKWEWLLSLSPEETQGKVSFD